MQAPVSTVGRLSPWLTTSLVLLSLATLINYIDRGNLATAAPIIKGELHLTGSQLGFLQSAFFITYVTAMPFVGWLCDRFGAARVLVAGFVIWSAATMLTGIAQGFISLLWVRLLLGVGESVAFPASLKLIVEHFPKSKLGGANGTLYAGMSLGPAVGTFFGGMLIAQYGWRPYFIGFGLASLLWVAAWSVVARRGFGGRFVPSVPAPPFTAILRKRSLWGASLGQFCTNFALYFTLTWIPYYLVHARGWSMTEMARIGGAAYLCMAAGAMASGWIADRWIAAGTSPTVARKTVLAVGGCCVAPCLIACVGSDARWSIVYLILACGALGLSYPHIGACAQTLAGPFATGRWVGVQNMFGNFAGVIAPWIAGIILDKTGSFTLTFEIAALISLVGVASWVFFVGPITLADWSKQMPDRVVAKPL